MTIYVDTGETVKTYPLNEKEAKAIMTLLESGISPHWSESHKGYGVAIKAQMALLESGVSPHWSESFKGYGVAIVDKEDE